MTEMKEKTANTGKVFLKNVSARLYVVGGVSLLPTQAAEFPEEVLHYPGVVLAMDDDELIRHDKAEAPIVDEAEAHAEAERRKKAAVGKTVKRNNAYVK